jgi:hypothetical protein
VRVVPELVALAREQQGLLHIDQLGEHGAAGLLKEREAAGEWRQLQPGVILPSTAVPTSLQRREAVRLSLEARQRSTGIPWWFSGVTAAQVLGLRVPEHPVVVTVLGSTRPTLADVHVLSTHQLPMVRTVKDLPVVTVPVAIVQCAALLARDDLVTLVEHALRDRRCTLSQLKNVCRRGVSGAAALRSVLEELSREGRDRWVRVLVRKLVAEGLPTPETERPLPEKDPRAWLDLCWWELLLAVEVDDWQTHASREAAEHDRARDRWMMTDYGLVVLRVTPREIRDHPARVVRDIVAAYRRAERAQRPAA